MLCLIIHVKMWEMGWVYGEKRIKNDQTNEKRSGCEKRHTEQLCMYSNRMNFAICATNIHLNGIKCACEQRWASSAVQLNSTSCLHSPLKVFYFFSLSLSSFCRCCWLLLFFTVFHPTLVFHRRTEIMHIGLELCVKNRYFETNLPSDIDAEVLKCNNGRFSGMIRGHRCILHNTDSEMSSYQIEIGIDDDWTFGTRLATWSSSNTH